jgi:hypothetical protein
LRVLLGVVVVMGVGVIDEWVGCVVEVSLVGRYFVLILLTGFRLSCGRAAGVKRNRCEESACQTHTPQTIVV